ncbi:MAG TPA: type II CAAX endopeptidase family protein [Pyrinomonadaceae bacterium]|nr:type II CAAX endopeptidase family protein [Pyrinomonadaceae bacterium]
MFTEEPSQQQITPLPEEHAEHPAIPAPAEVQLTPKPQKAVWWTPWIDVGIAVGTWFVSVLFLLFIPVIYALPYLIYRIAKTGAPSAVELASDKMLIFFSVAAILPTHVLTFVLIWVVVSYAGRRPFWKNIEFAWPPNSSHAMTTLVSVVVAIVLFSLAFMITMLYGERKTDLDLMIESSIYTRFATAFVAVVTAPLVEELIYRGLIYKALEKAAGVAVAIVIVSLLFAGVHVFQYRNNLAVIAVITLLSITLTVARAVTGKVLPAFIIHLVFNGIQSVLIVLGAFVGKDIIK